MHASIARLLLYDDYCVWVSLECDESRANLKWQHWQPNLLVPALAVRAAHGSFGDLDTDCNRCPFAVVSNVRGKLRLNQRQGKRVAVA
jgi:hypothetical protein